MAYKSEGLRQRVGRWLGRRGIGIAVAHQRLREIFREGIDQLQMHRSIILTSSLVDIDVKSVGTLHLERSLYTRRREDGYRRVVPVDGCLRTLTNLRKFGFLRLLLLGIIIARKPPSGMIARHGKLGTLFLDNEVVQIFLLGELVAEPDTIIVYTETDDDVALQLLYPCTICGRVVWAPEFVLPLHVQGYSQFVIVITNGSCFAPYGFPRLVESRSLFLGDGEALHQVFFVDTERGMTILCQFQTQMGRIDNGLALIRHFISWAPFIVEREFQFNVAVGRLDAAC